jgi:hypothetical protein
MPDFIITNIRIETEKHKRLKHIAVDNGVSFTELIRQVIDNFLEDESAVVSPRKGGKSPSSRRSRVRRQKRTDTDEGGRIIIR